MEEDTLQDFNNPTEFQPIIIPNRAKDHTIALSGEGAPTADINSVIGTCYVDVLNQVVYFKVKEATQEDAGWVPILTEAGINLIIATFLASGKYINKGNIDSYLIDYVTKEELTSTFNDYNPTIKMSDLTDMTDQVIKLNDNEGFYLTRNTAVTFELPSVDDLSILHKVFVQLNTTGITVDFSNVQDYFDAVKPTFAAAGMYNIIFEYDNSAGKWVCGSTYKGPES